MRYYIFRLNVEMFSNYINYKFWYNLIILRTMNLPAFFNLIFISFILTACLILLIKLMKFQ